MKKIKKKIPKIIFITFFVITIFVMIFTIISIRVTNNRNAVPIFGLSFYSIISGSMEPVLYPNDLIIVTAVKRGETPPEYEIGDIVVYQSFATENYGALITHRIVSINPDGRYMLKGDNNNTDDSLPVYPSQILGKYVGKISGGYKVISFLRSPLGFILVIILPVLILIILEGFNFVKLLKRYKDEKENEMNNKTEELNKVRLSIEEERQKAYEERLKAEQERLETERLLSEIKALKEQLDKGVKKDE